MRHPHGQVTILDPETRVVELDTITCAHCQQIVLVKPATAATVYYVEGPAGRMEEPGAMCRLCMKPVCLRCHERGRCTPFERRLERMEHHHILVE
jgi:hypothetical protein